MSDDLLIQSLSNHVETLMETIARQQQDLNTVGNVMTTSYTKLAELISTLTEQHALLAQVVQCLSGKTAFGEALLLVQGGGEAPADADPVDHDVPVSGVDATDTPPALDPLLLAVLFEEEAVEVDHRIAPEDLGYSLYVQRLSVDFDDALGEVWDQFTVLVEDAADLSEEERANLLLLSQTKDYSLDCFKHERMLQVSPAFVQWAVQSFRTGGLFEMPKGVDLFAHLYVWVQIVTGSLYTYRVRQAETYAETLDD